MEHIPDRDPNPPEPKVVMWCDYCNDGIFEGEEVYYHANGEIYCQNCCEAREAEKLEVDE